MIGGNVVLNVVPKWGLDPRIIFWGLKLHSERLVLTPGDDNLEFVYAGSVLYSGCVKRHEPVNAFNLVSL